MVDFNKSGTLPINVTFSAEPSPDNTLASHSWKVNGGTTEGTGSNFTKTFSSYNTYSITHDGVGTCGSTPCSTTKTISITSSPDLGAGLPIVEVVQSLSSIGFLGIVLSMLPPKLPKII